MDGAEMGRQLREAVHQYHATYERLRQLGLDDLDLGFGSRNYESLLAAYERGRQSVLRPKDLPLTGKAYLQQVMRDVSVTRGVSIVDIMGASRIKHIAHARQEVAWRMRQAKDERGKPRFSYPQIAEWMGGLDHTTIMHAVTAHEDRMQEADQ
jgi:hypothetical protein